jgi:hypothetical protein
MKLRCLKTVVVLVLLMQTAFAARLIDDFEDGNISKDPEWWKFGRLLSDVIKNKGKAPKGETLGKNGLSIEGSTRNWYIGGLGTYIGVDAGAFTHFEMLVLGSGKDSGQLKIELWDDDNKNWKAEADSKKDYVPIYDDVYAYTLMIDWEGWKRVTLPFKDFADSNPGVGNDQWDPAQLDGSGGLLQMSLVALGRSASGKVEVILDDVRLSAKEIKAAAETKAGT